MCGEWSPRGAKSQERLAAGRMRRGIAQVRHATQQGLCAACLVLYSRSSSSESLIETRVAWYAYTIKNLDENIRPQLHELMNFRVFRIPTRDNA